MKIESKNHPSWRTISKSDEGCINVERRPDGNYNVVITGQLAEKFVSANKSFENLKGHTISEAKGFGDILDEAISEFESNNPTC